MTVGDAFAEFRKQLEITDAEQKAASDGHASIREFLRSHFDSETDFLTGSYVRETKTRPLKDVDIFFVLKDTPTNREAFSEATNTLKTFAGKLSEKYEQVEARRRSVKVEVSAATDSPSFDVVPAFVRGAGGYEIPDAWLSKWIATDPKKHAEAATAKNKEMNDNWKPLVKMIKAWNRANEEPVNPSFLLEIIGLNIVDAPFGDYAYEVQTFFANAADRVQEDWADPAELGPGVNDEISASERADAAAALETAYRAAHEARRLERDVSDSSAVPAWRELMGDLFPSE